LEIIKKADADIVFLYEVTQNYFDIVNEQDWIRESYSVIVDPAVRNKTDERFFGNLCLCRAPILNSYFLHWTDEGIKHRPGIVLELYGLTIIGAHFKAFKDMAEVRKQMFGECVAVFDSVGCSENILVGDLNLENTFEEANIPEGFTDVWKSMYPNDEGCTFDGRVNGTIQFVHGSDNWKSRLDRILWKTSEHSSYQISSLEMIGKQLVFENADEAPTKRQAILNPSDHFGLMFHFTNNLFAHTQVNKVCW
jgi:endonuclease/exonuclease/phosphatase family metal-dependent hydrolase